MSYRNKLLPLLALLLVMPWITTMAASPDVTLQGLDGKDHHLSEYIGKGQFENFIRDYEASDRANSSP